MKFFDWMSPWTVLKGCAGFMRQQPEERQQVFTGSSRRKIVRKKLGLICSISTPLRLKILPISERPLIINIYEHKIRYGLSAAFLALISAGICLRLLDQFLDEKKKVTTQPYRDGSGIWTICQCHSNGWKNRFPNICETVEGEKCDPVSTMKW